MYTYQDLTNISPYEGDRMSFVLDAINEHKATKLYRTARIATDYAKHQNTTITQYQKILYTLSGRAVPDNWSANYKIPSNFFNRFITQEVQYLLGNGPTWQNDRTAKVLGDNFDTQLQKAAKSALIGGVSFGFFNRDHVEVFDLMEFVPLKDEENGAMKAGIRFWQVDDQKPLRATLYELDGYTEYMWVKNVGTVLHPKYTYKQLEKSSPADGTQIYNSENYPGFPIVPLWGNPYHQSEIVGLREQIDAYDLIKSGFANDLDDLSQIYWTVSNAGGMDDIDLARLVERLKTVHAVSVSDGEQVQSHSVDIPYSAREAILDRLKRDMYRDYMALDTDDIASGATTATQIKAAYEPLNSKCDEFEYCVIEFIKGILAVAGLDDDPTFTRSVMVNQSEELQNVILAADFLDDEYITEKVLSLLGDADKAEEVLQRRVSDEVERQRMQLQVAEEAVNDAEETEETEQ